MVTLVVGYYDVLEGAKGAKGTERKRMTILAVRGGEQSVINAL